MPLLLMRTLPRHAARPELPRERAAPDRLRRAAPACRGASRSRRTRSPIAPAPISTRRSACPGLGLKRGLADDLVIAPYATALAGLVDPAAAAEQLRAAARARARRAVRLLRGARLQRRAQATPTPSAGAGATRPAIVRAFFAHHQGMSLVALANVICDDAFVTRFHADPRVQATELLLQERVPREAILSEPRPAEGATRAPVGAGARVAALPVAAHGEPAHALPVERPLHRGAHARRRRLQHVARPGDHAPARRPHLGRRRALHLPARSVVGRRLVAHLSAGLPRARRVRRHVRARQGDVPPPRRRLRDAAAGHRVARGRRRGAAPVDHQPRRSAARDRGHELRRDRAGTARGRPRASGVRQAVHRDRVRRAERRPAVQPAAARARTKQPLWAFHVLGVEDGSAARSSGKPIARASSAAAARTANPIALDGRRCRARPAPCSIRSPRCAIASASRRARSCASPSPPASPPDRDAALALARKYRDGSADVARLLDGVHARAHHAAAPRPDRRPRHPLRSRSRRACSAPTPRASARRDLARNTLGAVESLGLRHLRRSADRARPRHRGRAPCRSCGSCCSRRSTGACKGLRADVVILNEHPADYLDEMQRQLDGAAAGAALGRLEGQARRHVPAARRRHAPRPIAICCAAVARVVLSRRPRRARRRSCDRPAPVAVRRARRRRAAVALAAPAPADRAGRPCRRSSWTNGLGGFTPDGREYVVVLDGDRETPLPWSNVLANPEFGTMVSSVGLRVHVGRQQPREPADAVRERSRSPIRPARRSTCATRTRAPCGARRRARCRAGRTPGAGSIRHAAGVTRYQHAIARAASRS